MTRASLALILILILTLVACGVDGPPERPAPRDGVTVSGDVRVGVTSGG